MEEQHKSIDEIFRQSLGDYREAPPAAAWDQVAARLDDDEGKRRRGFFLRWPWIALLLLLLAGGAWFIAAQYGKGPEGETADRQIAAVPERTGMGSAAKDGAPAIPGESLSGDRGLSDAAAAEEVRKAEDNERSSGVSGASGPEEAKPATGRRSDAPGTSGTSDAAQAASGKSRKSGTSGIRPGTGSGRDQSAINSGDPRTVSAKAPGRNGKFAEQQSSSDMQNRNRARTTSGRKAGTARTSSQSIQKQADEEAAGSGKAVPATEKPASAKKSAPDLASSPSRPKKASSERGLPNAPKKQTVASGLPNPPKKQSLETADAGPAVKTELSKRADGRKRALNTSGLEGSKPAVNTEKAAANPPKKTTNIPGSTAKPGSPTGEKGIPDLSKNTPVEKAATPDPVPSRPREPEVGKWHPTTEKDVLDPPPGSAKTNPLAVQNEQEDDDAEETTASQGAEPDADEDDEETAGKPEPGNTGSGGAGGSSGGEPVRKKTSISLAALAGYEFALEKPAPNNISAAFRLLWHFDPAIAVGIQPAFRYGNVSSTAQPSTAYQRTSPIRLDSVVRYDSVGAAIVRTYLPSQTYDSIVVSGLRASGGMWQIELPIILSYRVAKAVTIYGGPSIHLGGKINASSGDIQTYSFQRKDSVPSAGGTVQPPRSAASFEGYFGTSSLPDFSTYSPSNQTLADPATVRFGYIFGLGFEHKRILFDASLHQQVSGFKQVAQPFQKIYSSPSVRVSIGYTLFPQKNRRKPAIE